MGVIVQKLGELCDGEGIEAQEEALTLIARTAQGSLRDAENLLEQAAVSYGSPLSDEQVRDLLGLGGDETSLDLTEHTIKGGVPEALTVIDQVAGQGSDLRQLHTGTVEYLRAVLLVKTGVGMPPGYPEDTAQRIGALAKSGPMENILHALKTFSEVDLRRDSSSSLPLELAVVESAGGPPARAREPAAGVQAAGPRAASPPGPPSHSQPARERPGPRTASPPPRQAPRPTPTGGRRQRPTGSALGAGGEAGGPVAPDHQGSQAHGKAFQPGRAAARLQRPRGRRQPDHTQVPVRVTRRADAAGAERPGDPASAVGGGIGSDGRHVRNPRGACRRR